MIRLPARTRADLAFYTALYAGMWLGAITKTLFTGRKSTPAPDPLEVPREDVPQ